ncbi:hypothetical protein N9D77_03290 [Paracoccaceae bacterium]|nr:hypothetical protein [Paracoccaceae bacterium]
MACQQINPPTQNNCYPVCIFGYKRANKLENCLDALLKCPRAEYTNVYIFLDGPKTENERCDINLVHAVAKSYVKAGFASCHIKIRKSNIGLANSVISGVSEVLVDNKAVIVVEDDLLPTKDFLIYMNTCLNKYAHDKSVGSVSGFGYKLYLRGASSIYFHGRPNTWGWGTWKDRWSEVDWEIDDTQFIRSDKFKRKFNTFGGQDLHRMLIAYLDQRIDSWGIRWAYHHYVKNLKAVSPVYSKIYNDGYGDDGTNCNANSIKPDASYVIEEKLMLPSNTDLKALYTAQVKWQHSNFLKVIKYIIKRCKSIFHEN